jgi:hypothetical protein
MKGTIKRAEATLSSTRHVYNNLPSRGERKDESRYNPGLRGTLLPDADLQNVAKNKGVETGRSVRDRGG